LVSIGKYFETSVIKQTSLEENFFVEICGLRVYRISINTV
jgi:hypothetical protein